MSLLDHIRELRTRLLWVVGALLIGTLLGMLFAEPLLRFIVEPLTELGAKPHAIGPTDTLVIFFKVSFTAGTILASPMIVYQAIAFTAPGLYPHERRVLMIVLPGILLLFALGAIFAYYVLLPAFVGFLQAFLGNIVIQDWTIDRYVSFITRVVFWMGISFEAPIVVALLARIGLLSGQQMKKYWRHAMVLIALFAAFATPTVDPLSMLLFMAPLVVLYFFSMWLAYILYRPRVPRDFSKEDFFATPGKDN